MGHFPVKNENLSIYLPTYLSIYLSLIVTLFPLQGTNILATSLKWHCHPTCTSTGKICGRWDAFKQFLSSQNLPESVAQVDKAGIVLGAPHFTTLSDRQLKDIYWWLTRLCPNTALPTSLPWVAQTYTRVLRINDYDFATVYRKNEHVIVSDYD